MKKSILFSLAALFALIAVIGCFASDGVSYTADDYVLVVPSEYNDLVKVSEKTNDMLFSVNEIASIEATAEGVEDDGIGWLFGIGFVSEENGHKILCNDMSGTDVFAKDADGNYFIFYHPTDVRMVREDYNDKKSIAQWTALNEWADSVKDAFIKDNKGLVEEKHGNTDLDIFINRLMYLDDAEYEIISPEHDILKSGFVNAVDYIVPLSTDVIYEYADSEETPSGGYITVNFPLDDIRFDFFLEDGNYIRRIWNGAQDEVLYKAVFDKDDYEAAEIINDLYDAMIIAKSSDKSADVMIGTWAEMIAGRGTIEITKAETEGEYNIEVFWSQNAAQMAHWRMTGKTADDGAKIIYDDCEYSIITFDENGGETVEVRYENGSGSLYKTSRYEIAWDDNQDQVAKDTVFVLAK